MKNLLPFFCLGFICLTLISCSNQPLNESSDTSFQNEKSELIAMGSYPNYYYNLANDLSNNNRIEEAIDAYLKCIETSESQTFVEDAMFNLSALYFEQQQDSLAYLLMDQLIDRKYTWLSWYKGGEEYLLAKKDYQLRLTKIDSVLLLKEKPENCIFHYQDVDHFIHAFQQSQKDWENAPTYFYQDYFSKASKGLFFYQKFKIQSSSHLFAYRVEDKKEHFASIIPNLERLQQQEDTLRAYLNKFEQLYPPAIFPDVYYTVGCFNAGGTSSPFGLLIGAEMHSKTENSSLVNFNNWEKKVVRNFSNLPLITIHELVHIQQKDNYTTLLGNSIFEGAADFVCDLICGSHINEYVHEWANEREVEIWEEFKTEMHQENASNWIGNANNAKDKPADLGYYVGYKICESYYQKQEDKSAAIHDILTIEDWDDFYLKSGYMQE